LGNSKHRGLGQFAFEREATQAHSSAECYYACDEYFPPVFFCQRTRTIPTSFEPEKHFSWIRGRQVGGKSHHVGPPELSLERPRILKANAKKESRSIGRFRYAELAPWYGTTSEEFAGISGQAEGLPQLPDGKIPSADGR